MRIPLSDENLIPFVRGVALAAHSGQMYGDKPYIYHLDKVVGVLRRAGFDHLDVIAAGILHDVLEDTDVNAETLREFLPEHVVKAIEFCTEGPGKKATYARMRAVVESPSCDMIGPAVKLAVRVANLQESIQTGNEGLLRMYRKEHADFCHALGLDIPEVSEILDPLIVEYNKAMMC